MVHMLLRTIFYNAIELTLLVSIAVSAARSEHIWGPLLWIGFVGSLFWFLAASFKQAEEEVYLALKERVIFLTDFMAGFLIYLALAFLVRHEFYPFLVMYLVVAGQQLRYSILSYKFLIRQRYGNKDNKTP